MILYSGGRDIRIASVLGIFSISSRPFSGPITVTAVAKASASIAFWVMMVTLESLALLSPVFVSMMWLCLFPSIRAKRL